MTGGGGGRGRLAAGGSVRTFGAGGVGRTNAGGTGGGGTGARFTESERLASLNSGGSSDGRRIRGRPNSTNACTSNDSATVTQMARSVLASRGLRSSSG